MKKNIFLVAAVISLSLSLSSCIKKCQVCTKEGAENIDVCKSDYEDNSIKYWEAMQQTELQGYDCKNK